MNKIILLFIFILISFSLSKAQTPQWDFASAFGGTGTDQANKITCDGLGNLYLTGEFASDELILGEYKLHSTASMDVFLIKIDSTGHIVWAKSAGSEKTDECKGIALDKQGNIYITGSFGGTTIAFDTNQFLTNTGTTSIFIAKYSPDGKFIWATGPEGAGNSHAYAIAADQNSALYITGGYASPALKFGKTTLPPTNALGGFFVASFDSAGNATWASAADGNGTEKGTGLALGNHGDIFVGGSFTSSKLSFDNAHQLMNAFNGGTYNGFWAKYDRQGNLKKCFGIGKNLEVTSLVVDGDDQIYVAGVFQDTLKTGNNFIISESGKDGFVSKIDTSGNNLWLRGIQGNFDDYLQDINIDSTGNISGVGYSSSPEIKIETTKLVKNGSQGSGNSDLFAFRFDSTGKLQWAINGGGRDSEYGMSIVAESNGNTFIAGGGGSMPEVFGKIECQTKGLNDILFLKMRDQEVSGIIDPNNIDFSLSIYPNPTEGVFSITAHLPLESVEIYDMMGKIVIRMKIEPGSTSPIYLQNNGVYLIRVNCSGNKWLSGSILVK